jgi:hypothetical protein
LWAQNRRRFLEKWMGDGIAPRLAGCEPERFARNREIARAVAEWMDRYFTMRDREDRRHRRFFARNGALRSQTLSLAHRAWRRIRPRLPARLADRLGAAARRVG